MADNAEAAEEAPEAGPNQQADEPPQYVEMSLDGRFGRVRALPSVVGEP